MAIEEVTEQEIDSAVLAELPSAVIYITAPGDDPWSIGRKYHMPVKAVREAIRKLELEGLVVMTPRRSAEVAKITKEDLVDVLEVRRVLEALSIELCCKNRTKEEIVLLKENLGKFKKSVESGDLTEIAKTDVQFHEIIYNATGNRRLNQILYNLREQMYRYRLEYIKDRQTRNTLIQEHQEIIDSIEKKDIERAKKAILVHIDNQERTILENMDKAGN